MLQTGSRMLPLSVALGMVWLTFGLESAKGSHAFRDDCYRRTCNSIEYDPHKAVCCENKLHSGAGLSCCGKESFNSAEATCCKVEHQQEVTAHVTQGLSQGVSCCCGLKAYNPLNEICCNSTVKDKTAANSQCCGEDAFDEKKQLCCGPHDKKKILLRNSSHHECCGVTNQYDTMTQCCCLVGDTFEIHPNNSSCCDIETTLCGQKAYDEHNELCCESTLVAKSTPASKCCGKKIYDEEKQLCCGPHNEKETLDRNSSHHECCGVTNQYDTRTQCCCWVDGALKILSINSNCCEVETSVQQETGTEPIRPKTNNIPCGSSFFGVTEYHCCERDKTQSSGQGIVNPTVNDPHQHVCRADWICSDQCWGATQSSLAHHKLLCCHQETDRKNGAESSDSDVPYLQSKGTICCNKFHGSQGQHCCGTELYTPHSEVCCNGHRHPKEGNKRCCGVEAYNIQDKLMKCCAGTLYSLSSNILAHEAQCCGSSLQKSSHICCSSEHKEVLYPAKMGFRCCGHLYYNTSVWSCCAGSLSPAHKHGRHQNELIKKPRLVSMSNLTEEHLCEEMLVGTVDSVSLHSVVFSNVLIIFGRNATVEHLPSTHILRAPNHCSSPTLTLGKTYFFDKVDVIIDFTHDSLLQSLHFIFSICYRP